MICYIRYDSHGARLRADASTVVALPVAVPLPLAEQRLNFLEGLVLLRMCVEYLRSCVCVCVSVALPWHMRAGSGSLKLYYTQAISSSTTTQAVVIRCPAGRGTVC